MKTKTIILRIIFSIMVLATMLLIFSFSSDTGEESGGKSRAIIVFISKIIHQEENETFLDQGEMVVRKLAHFTIYCCLGISEALLINTYNLEHKERFLYPIILGFIYAITDEIHQGSTIRKSTCNLRCRNRYLWCYSWKLYSK